jgi:FtsH-binding integral membrane protein
VRPARQLPGRKYDHHFFSAMALLLTAAVFIGFAPTYYLAGMLHAPLPDRLIHIHGALFTSWMFLLIAQTSLVAAGKVNVHRRLGIAGCVLACVMVPLGVLAGVDSLVRRGGPPGRDSQAFFIVPFTEILIFGVLMLFAFRARKDSPTHKRLIMIATLALTLAAVARWPMFHRSNLLGAAITTWIFLLLLAAYDLWTTRRVHRATIWGSAFLIFVQLVRMPISHTTAWHAFAGWVQTTAAPMFR